MRNLKFTFTEAVDDIHLYVNPRITPKAFKYRKAVRTKSGLAFKNSRLLWR